MLDTSAMNTFYLWPPPRQATHTVDPIRQIASIETYLSWPILERFLRQIPLASFLTALNAQFTEAQRKSMAQLQLLQ